MKNGDIESLLQGTVTNYFRSGNSIYLLRPISHTHEY